VKEALKMNVTYRDLNDKEVAVPIGEFVRLLDEYTELKQQVIALQEIIANIIEINTEGK
jgi:hypothetical protein